MSHKNESPEDRAARLRNKRLGHQNAWKPVYTPSVRAHFDSPDRWAELVELVRDAVRASAHLGGFQIVARQGLQWPGEAPFDLVVNVNHPMREVTVCTPDDIPPGERMRSTIGQCFAAQRDEN